MRSFNPRHLVAVVAAVVAGACADISAPETATSLGMTANVENPQNLELCKVGPAGSQATFSVSATSGTLPLGNTVTLNAVPEIGTGCTVIWTATYPEVVGQISTVTVKEIAATPGTMLEYIVQNSALDGWSEPSVAGKTAVIRVSYNHGGTIWFKNVGTPSNGGSRGCTPGYWKQSHHFDSWPAAYTPGMQFSTVFANAFPGKTLLQVLSAGGGGLNALGRHTVAALLNSGTIDYGMSAPDVVAAFNAAYASGNYEAQKNIFEGMNERGCPLN